MPGGVLCYFSSQQSISKWHQSITTKKGSFLEKMIDDSRSQKSKHIGLPTTYRYDIFCTIVKDST